LASIQAKPPLRALADVRIHLPDGELTIRRCAVFQRDGQPPWASLPRIAFEKNGKRQFVPLIDLSGELKKRVLEAVLDEYRRKS
jgi:hypothetical protein